jgi:hypothetical protein
MSRRMKARPPAEAPECWTFGLAELGPTQPQEDADARAGARVRARYRARAGRRGQRRHARPGRGAPDTKSSSTARHPTSRNLPTTGPGGDTRRPRRSTAPPCGSTGPRTDDARSGTQPNRTPLHPTSSTSTATTTASHQAGLSEHAQESAGRIVKAPPSSGATARKWRSSKVRIRRVR